MPTDFCDDIEWKLRGLPAITSLVGKDAAARVYPDVPKQGVALPFIVYAEAGGESEEHLTGASGLCHAVVHIYAYGATRHEANHLAEQIRTQLQKRLPKTKWGNSWVNEVSCARHRDAGIDSPLDGQDKQRYWTRRIYDIWHEESVVAYG